MVWSKERDENRERQIRKVVFFDDEEWQFIKKKMVHGNYKYFTNFARHMLMLGEAKTYDYSELKEIKKELNAIGKNINQLVKLAHYVSELPIEAIEELQSQVNEVKKLYNEKIKNEIRATRRK